MDNEKDFYIKQKLQEDTLMSKKAEDVFNNFFGGKMNMEMEDEDKIVDINDSKDKKIQRKKILGIVATLIVVFLGANVYAATQGYNNIFFMIKNISSTGTITGKSEILKDQDITISYEPIEIAQGITVQFNRFVVKDNKAKLIMKVDQNGGMASDKKISQVEVMNGNNNSQLATASLKNEDDGIYTKEIEIGFFNNDIKVLKVNINSSKENLAEIEIDLNNREIKVLSNSYKEIEKISEIELKEALSKYATLNLYEDTDQRNLNYENKPTKEQYINFNLFFSAVEYIAQKEAEEGVMGEINYTAEKVNKAIKEMTGIVVKDKLDMSNDYCEYDSKEKKYIFANGDFSSTGLCLNITDISYEEGIYTVDYQYCYPEEADFYQNTINELPVYESTLQFKLNDNYEYAKYCIVSNIYELKSKKIKNAKLDESTNTNNTSNTSNTIYVNNTVNTSNTVTISNSVYIPTANESVEDEYTPIELMAWEYRDSLKIKNYKDFNYDLDGDGLIDKITIRKDKSDEYGMNYLFELNGTTFTENNLTPEIFIADLNTTDNTVEVVIFEWGSSDEFKYHIYSKNGNNMEEVVVINGSELNIDSQGNLKAKSMLTAGGMYPDVYDKIYTFEGNNIIEKDNEIDTNIEYSVYGMYYITKDLGLIEDIVFDDWDSFEKALKEAGIEKLDEIGSFKIKEFIDETKAIIEYNGEEYYLLSPQAFFVG